MRALLLVVALSVCGYAWSDNIKEPIVQTKSTQQKTTTDKQGTEQIPFVIKIAAPKKSDAETKEEQTDKTEHSRNESLTAKGTIALAVITAILSFATIILAGFTWKLWSATVELGRDAKATSARQATQMQRSLDLSERQLRIEGAQTDIIEKQHAVGRLQYFATHRPKIRVRNVVIKNPIPIHASAPKTLFVKGQPISGQFYIANIGGSEAVITGIGCWVIARYHQNAKREDFLPMERPYEGEAPNIFSGGDTTKLMVGGSMPIPFTGDAQMNDVAVNQFNLKRQTTLLTSEGWWHLYVMGYIEYFDIIETNSTYRRTAFCREFDPIGERFIKVANEDYEYEE